MKVMNMINEDSTNTKYERCTLTPPDCNYGEGLRREAKTDIRAVDVHFISCGYYSESGPALRLNIFCNNKSEVVSS